MNCAKCGSPASKYNEAGIPVCGTHAKEKFETPSCPECGMAMSLREGKWGKFWGCSAYPMCVGTQKL
ncbi:MAG: topoisomerase DNA-binding C4 zinc finger domain-containing protein [Candidatus Diapherotrites archaeon]